jgi:hypothetical protein
LPHCTAAEAITPMPSGHYVWTGTDVISDDGFIKHYPIYPLNGWNVLGTNYYAKPDPSDWLPLDQNTIDQWMVDGQIRSYERRQSQFHLPARYQRVILVVILVVVLWATVIADSLNRYLVH